jgi:hypothetical protein
MTRIRLFVVASRPALGTISVVFVGYRRLSFWWGRGGVNLQERETDKSPLSSSGFGNAWTYTFTASDVFMASGLRTGVALPYLYIYVHIRLSSLLLYELYTGFTEWTLVVSVSPLVFILALFEWIWYCGVFTPCKNCNIETRSRDYVTVDEAVFSACRAEPNRERVAHRVASPRLVVARQQL